MVLLTRMATISAARPAMATMLKTSGGMVGRPARVTVVVSILVVAKALVSVVVMTCEPVVEGRSVVCSEAVVDVAVDGCEVMVVETVVVLVIGVVEVAVRRVDIDVVVASVWRVDDVDVEMVMEMVEVGGVVAADVVVPVVCVVGCASVQAVYHRSAMAFTAWL